MMHSVLVAGSNQISVGELLERMGDTLTCISCSLHYVDLVRHLELFKPELFILCLKNESENTIRSMIEFKKQCEKQNVVFIILGDETDCEQFKQEARYVADLVLVKPITNRQIIVQIENCLAERRQIESEVLEENRKLRAECGDTCEIEPGIFARVVPTPQIKKHVLVVDDDANMLKLIKRYLEDSYEVATALNGKLAVQFLARKHTDLIVLDYMMPEGAGDEVLAVVRSYDKTKNIPVLFLTGVTDPEKIKKVLAFKPQGYLLKPVDREKLLAAVKEQIG